MHFLFLFLWSVIDIFGDVPIHKMRMRKCSQTCIIYINKCMCVQKKSFCENIRGEKMRHLDIPEWCKKK